MNREEWLESCRERGRRGGLKAAHLRRKVKAASAAEEARKNARFVRRCDCGAELHMGICPSCD